MKTKWGAALLGALAVLAVQSAPARAQNVQGALEDAKTSITGLVDAKDADAATPELKARTLAKAVALAVEEAKSVRAELSDLEGLAEAEKEWRDARLKDVKAALVRLASFKTELAKDDATSESVVAIAQAFKEWRAESWMPLVAETTDRLLVSRQDETVALAAKRWQKVNADVVKLEKTKSKKTAAAELRGMLDKAEDLIGESKALNKQARAVFLAAIATSTATATEAVAAPAETASSTETAESVPPKPGIRDLVNGSVQKTRDAYKIFIEMSALVRKLLSK